MPNIGTVLKEEVTRLARKEIRRETAAVQKASSQHRRDIAAMKRQVVSLTRQVALLERKVLAERPMNKPAEKDARVRFTAKGLRSQRRRLGMSAADYAKLVGVTQQSIYNWERESSRPRKGQLVVLAALRGMGKKEALARLRQLTKQKQKSTKK